MDDVIKYVQGLMKKMSQPKTNEGDDYTDVFEKISEIKNQVGVPEKPNLGEGVKYERIEYDAPTDDEIGEQAKASLSEYETASKNAIENEISSLFTKYGIDKQNNALAYENAVKSIEDAYKTAVESASNDALKRGVARSSIAVNTIGALEKSQAEAKVDASALYEKNKADLDAKISGLEAQRQKAMDEFNIAYTAKLTQQINALKAEREEKAQEAIRYNNSLTEKENKEHIDREKAESDLYTEALEQFKTEKKLKNDPDAVTQDVMYQQIYGVLRDKLLTMSAAEAKKEVNDNPLFRRYLSDAYFYKLYDEFGR